MPEVDPASDSVIITPWETNCRNTVTRYWPWMTETWKPAPCPQQDGKFYDRVSLESTCSGNNYLWLRKEVRECSTKEKILDQYLESV